MYAYTITLKITIRTARIAYVDQGLCSEHHSGPEDR